MTSRRASPPRQRYYVLIEIWRLQRTIWTHRNDAIFASWWRLVRFPFSDISPPSYVISFAFCSHDLQIFLWYETFFEYLMWFEISVKNTQTLNRAFGLVMAFSLELIRNEGGLRVAHSHLEEDQPFLLATLSWLVNYFHFLMELGKSLNYHLKQAAISFAF